MVKIILTELQEQSLMQKLINEEVSDGDVRLEVINYLNNNFIKADKSIINDKGDLQYKKLVIWVDKNKEPIKTLSIEDLFWLLQDKFKNIKSDKKIRDAFIWDTLKSWYLNQYNKKTGNIY